MDRWKTIVHARRVRPHRANPPIDVLEKPIGGSELSRPPDPSQVSPPPEFIWDYHTEFAHRRGANSSFFNYPTDHVQSSNLSHTGGYPAPQSGPGASPFVAPQRPARAYTQPLVQGTEHGAHYPAWGRRQDQYGSVPEGIDFGTPSANGISLGDLQPSWSHSPPAHQVAPDPSPSIPTPSQFHLSPQNLSGGYWQPGERPQRRSTSPAALNGGPKCSACQYQLYPLDSDSRRAWACPNSCSQEISEEYQQGESFAYDSRGAFTGAGPSRSIGKLYSVGDVEDWD